LTYRFEELGQFTVVAMSEDNGVEHIQAEQRVIVKYVRRELLKMLPADRQALLDAMKVTYTVGTDVGRTIYGENYLVRGFSIRTCSYVYLHIIFCEGRGVVLRIPQQNGWRQVL
jgi:hypothetical protein